MKILNYRVIENCFEKYEFLTAVFVTFQKESQQMGFFTKKDERKEPWDVYDRNKKPLGKTRNKGDDFPDGEYHLDVRVWIKNDKDEYLFEQRAFSRKRNPAKWDCVTGSVQAGETSIHAAIRESEEEVTAKLDEKDGTLLFSEVDEEYHAIIDTYLFTYNGTIDKKNLEMDEVAQARWFKKDDIVKMFGHNLMVDTIKYFVTDGLEKKQ